MDISSNIKTNLITRIKNTSDLNLLKALQSILNTSENTLFELTDEQLKSIERSRIEIENGKFIENDQAISELKEWLAKE